MRALWKILDPKYYESLKPNLILYIKDLQSHYTLIEFGALTKQISLVKYNKYI